MKLKILLSISLLVATACQTTQLPGPLGEAPIPAPAPVASSLAPILEIASKSGCEKTVHQAPNSKGKMVVQGRPPVSFLKGIALTYVKEICTQGPVIKAISQPVGSPSTDALAHLGLSPSGSEKIAATTASLVVGSVAFESSWRWCVGRDILAKESDVQICLYGDGSTCESGYGQTSFNSIGSNQVLKDLFKKFSSYPAACFAKEYKGSTTCKEYNLKNFGSGADAVKYQELSKHCPGFAIESHLVMLRIKRAHYGPINIKQAQAKPQCTSMFESLSAAVKADPNICLNFK